MPAEPLAKGAILVADGRPIFRSSVRLILESFGYRVQEAPGASSAAKLARNESLDAVVIDAQLTSGQWMAMVIAIRLKSAVPILVLAPRHRKGEFPGGGMIHTIQRPFSLEAFVEAISQTMRAGPNRQDPPGSLVAHNAP